MNMMSEPVQDDTADRLIEALNQDGFVLYHQPILPVCGSPRDGSYQEILIRFKEEEEKLLPPGTFIPILESSRLMHILDRWVLNRVIKWIHAKRRTDPQWNAPCSSLNLSNDTLTHPEFATFVKQQLHKGKVSGRKFALEITESDAGLHPEAVATITGTLRPEGCGVTLTSYTGEKIAAERLSTLGIDAVKLDIDIVSSLDSNPASYALAEKLQAMCKAHGVRTIAEFVEKKSTLERLKALGVGYAQGYGVAMPGPLA